ncbi:hypothetical protein FJV76_11680 [Mesorhizobium sp. WSM4303]|uniref:hypothetical protein n=1 Tax=unclassified Mesorhizobium TaxID=325217 RepID=UPI00115D7F41|nr:MULTISPECIES: hypothetical protein [unclassified Mesorhizobium]TRC93267.1 hypothetical protein FJV77_22410 [Mesorhizobium sp. WSM4306]TRD04935.1 hypothetical protein FJV76_11680 [Mesorhizobium sp. WSM4303]
MTFADQKWSPSEKKVARNAYDAALKVALDKTMADLKSKAHAAATPSEMWDVEDFLRQQRRKIDQLFDYRYSQLIEVFAGLIRQGYLDENLLVGLSEDKRQMVWKYASWNGR